MIWDRWCFDCLLCHYYELICLYYSTFCFQYYSLYCFVQCICFRLRFLIKICYAYLNVAYITIIQSKKENGHHFIQMWEIRWCYTLIKFSFFSNILPRLRHSVRISLSEELRCSSFKEKYYDVYKFCQISAMNSSREHFSTSP